MFDKKTLRRVDDLVKSINDHRTDDDYAASYLDTPALREIASILEAGYSEEKDALGYIYGGYSYIAEQYTAMGRFSLAADYRFAALKTAQTLYLKYKVKAKGVEDVLYNLLRDRNYYEDDDCLDVYEETQYSDMLDPEVVKKMYQQRMNRRRSLKHDPVEKSEAYLAVIDEVEERIAKNRTVFGMGACHEIWALKAEYLAEKGSNWNSPHMLNPGVMFD